MDGRMDAVDDSTSDEIKATVGWSLYFKTMSKKLPVVF